METYKEAKEISREFEADLKALLKKYNATIELEDLPTKYPYSIPEKTIKVYISSHNRDENCFYEFTEIDLGGYISYD